MRIIGHWAGGKPVEGVIRSQRPGLRPRLPVSKPPRSLSPPATKSMPPSGPPRRRSSSGRAPRSATRAKALFAFRELVHAHTDELAAIITASTARCSPTRAARSRAGWRSSSSPAACRSCSRVSYSEQVSTGVDVFSFRQPLGVVSPASRRSTSRRWSRMWMSPIAIACGNAFVLKPSERDPSASLLIAELWKRPGLPDGVFNVVHGDKEAVDAMLDHPRRGGRVASSAPPRSPSTSTRPAPRTASGCRRSAGPRTTLVVLPDADLDWPPTPPSRPATAPPASAAWPSRPRSPSATSADPLVDAIVAATRAKLTRSAPAATADADMGPLITAEHRDRVARLHRPPASSRAPRLAVDGRGLRVPGHEDGLLPRADPARPRHAGHGGLPRRDLRPGPFASSASTPRRGARPDQRQPVRQRHRDLHPRRRRRPASSSATSRSGMVGINVPIPVPDGLLLLRRLEGLAVRRHPHLRPRGRPLLHPRQGRHLPLAGPVDLAEHQQAQFSFPTAR